MSKKITIDPVTRIEGHLRIDVEVDNDRVTNAWSSAQMFRGIETILKGKRPEDAWSYAQRFCGVCTTVHAIASIRSVENALNVQVPLNGQYLRNLMIAMHSMQDHIVHFYHLSALDWVDITSCLKADPKKTSLLAESMSDFGGHGVDDFKNVQEKLKHFVDSGRLGIFASGYWGHQAMKLSPEENLLLFSHYLTALDYQKKAAQAVAVIGGKNPHIQNLVVGGVATAVNMDNMATLNVERLSLIRKKLGEVKKFIDKVYMNDLVLLANRYREWFDIGRSVGNYIAVPEYPLDTNSKEFLIQGGIFFNGEQNIHHRILDHSDDYLINNITESSEFAWYNNPAPLHPWDGSSDPRFTGYDYDSKYTWCKAPRFKEKAIETGPVAQILAGYHTGNEFIKREIDFYNSTLSIDNSKYNSTMGRLLARGYRAKFSAETAEHFLDKLIENIAAGDSDYANPTEIPSGEYKGVGFHEAPRGMLSHFIHIKDKKIENYQAVVPSTWNASPRDENGVMGPYENSLINTQLAETEKPLEILRTIHSYDPCIACAVHAVDPDGGDIVKVKVL
ncbi:nickel-dependent hydrogenase large subunit [Flexistipes sp.]|uniref:nickel-dependent hydrogenase large subunit n=1 Tax=Flexistipes sp. TaxID=3088135 RepID=UPI002E1C64D0|nr:nickel-dependent hydrogenase large subunit [Flexistipes sp.]